MTGKKTQELCNEIVGRIASGEPLRQICRDEHMPSFVAVYDWIREDEEFALRIARAREDGADAIADEILAIADDGSNDWMEKKNENGDIIGWSINGEHVQRSKLRVDARLKLLAKWHPKKYGDKITTDVNHSGSVSFESEYLKRLSRSIIYE